MRRGFQGGNPLYVYLGLLIPRGTSFPVVCMPDRCWISTRRVLFFVQIHFRKGHPQVMEMQVISKYSSHWIKVLIHAGKETFVKHFLLTFKFREQTAWLGLHEWSCDLNLRLQTFIFINFSSAEGSCAARKLWNYGYLYCYRYFSSRVTLKSFFV